MSDKNTDTTKRPAWPKRAIVTGGMPYGNKDLHFGHIGGVFVQADAFARFLRDRIGEENVIFVSGTDCYGSPIVEYHRAMVEKGEYEGTLEEFVSENHERQKKTLTSYCVAPNFFAASSIGRASEVHRQIGAEIITKLYENGFLEKRTTPQFYDTERDIFLNGRQVLGRCPIEGCRSDKAYADECSLGHQYEPKDLIAPKSAITGNTPEMRDVTNWYIKMSAFREILEPWVKNLRDADPQWRHFVVSSIQEYFEPPIIHITKDQIEALQPVLEKLPPHEEREGRGNSLQLVFESLEEMESAREVLAASAIRYRSGKTLVPFRLTGNLDWGLPVPELDGLKDLTFWVWPESLWAPISFSATYLEQQGKDLEEWRDWWCSKDSKMYQFIGEDNVYFYSLPEMAMFLGMQGPEPDMSTPEGCMQMPHLIANRHLLFLDKKASSSSDIKPPMASDLLNYYTPDQLRIHFFSLALGLRSTSFRPKPLNPKANPKEGDPVLREGNLLSNAFNRSARSCFYTLQKFFDGKLPAGTVSEDAMVQSEKTILAFEEAMYKHEFQQTVVVVGDYIRDINQRWSQNKPYSDDVDDATRAQALIDAFHMVRVATVLLHPIAPEGTEIIREYYNIGEEFWSWERIFDSLFSFIKDPATHEFKFLEPRVDFFNKHESQY